MSRKSICMMQKVIIFIAICSLLLIFGVWFGSSFMSSSKANAAAERTNYKYYKSIQIESGESLWSIAQKYKTQDFKDISSYIREIKNINNLDSSKIHEGHYLTIPYNSYSKL